MKGSKLLSTLSRLYRQERYCTWFLTMLSFLVGGSLRYLYHSSVDTELLPICSTSPVLRKGIGVFSIIQYLEDLFDRLQEVKGIWLESVSIDSKGIDIEGNTERPQCLSAWISSISKVFWIEKVILAQLRSEVKIVPRRHYFQIHIELKRQELEAEK